MMQIRWAAALFVVMLAVCTTAVHAHDKACQGIPPEKIRAQLYSFFSEIAATEPGGKLETTDERLSATFGALQRAGFRHIERVAGTFNKPLSRYRSIAKKYGISAVASHEDLNRANWEAKLDEAKAFGQRYVGSGGFGTPGIDSLANTLATAANLNDLGEAAASKGLHFYVHNHWRELQTKFPYDLHKTGREESVSAWEIIAANTNPAYVSFEVDVHWARIAVGLDHFDELLAFLMRNRGRIVMLHVKDTAPDGSIADLGKGTTDWPAVFEAAGPQIRYYLWEYDSPPDPEKSARIAYEYLSCQK